MLATGGSGCYRALGRSGDLLVDLLLKRVELAGAQDAFAQQAHLQLVQRVAHGVGFALFFEPVVLVVVGLGVRIGANAMPVHEGRPLAGAAVLYGGLEG
jgi:hypothetical protein